MAETQRKRPSKSRKVFVKVPKSKRPGRRNIRYRNKTVSDEEEESLVKNADLDQQDFFSEMRVGLHTLPCHKTETLGSQDELGSKESRNYVDKSENISSSTSSKIEQITETNQQCPELIIKSFSDVAINSDDNEHVGVNSGKIEVCYFEENPYEEEVMVGCFETLQAESPITAHDQRKSESQRIPTSAEITTKPKRSNTFADKRDSRQSETGRRVKTVKRVSKKRWKKKTKKSKKTGAEGETLQISISGDKDSEIIEILEMDEDDRRQRKRERRKKREKKAKKMAKTAGVTVWKGIREGWKLMWSGLAMYTLPLGSLDVSTNIAKVWPTKTTQ